MATVDDYVNGFEGAPREWLDTFVGFMRERFPALQEVISYGIPTYKFGRMFIAFSIAKDHFTFHTVDFEMIEELKARLPKAKFGKGSAKVKFADKAAIPVLFEAAREIVSRHAAPA